MKQTQNERPLLTFLALKQQINTTICGNHPHNRLFLSLACQSCLVMQSHQQWVTHQLPPIFINLVINTETSCGHRAAPISLKTTPGCRCSISNQHPKKKNTRPYSGIIRTIHAEKNDNHSTITQVPHPKSKLEILRLLKQTHERVLVLAVTTQFFKYSSPQPSLCPSVCHPSTTHAHTHTLTHTPPTSWTGSGIHPLRKQQAELIWLTWRSPPPLSPPCSLPALLA